MVFISDLGEVAAAAHESDYSFEPVLNQFRRGYLTELRLAQNLLAVGCVKVLCFKLGNHRSVFYCLGDFVGSQRFDSFSSSTNQFLVALASFTTEPHLAKQQEHRSSKAAFFQKSFFV